MAEDYEAHGLTGAYNAHYDRPAMLAAIGSVDGLDVLDAGCGPGPYADALAKQGAHVTAIDQSAPMLDLARARLDQRARLIQADLNEPLPFRAAHFDRIVKRLGRNLAQ